MRNVTVGLCNADEPEQVEALGQFDGVYCSSLLYHLLEPWKFVAALRSITPTLFLSTHYTAYPNAVRNGFDVQVFPEFGYRDSLSGLREESTWLSMDSLILMLESAGFAVTKMQMIPNWRSPLHPMVWPMANILCQAVPVPGR